MAGGRGDGHKADTRRTGHRRVVRPGTAGLPDEAEPRLDSRPDQDSRDASETNDDRLLRDVPPHWGPR